MSFLGSRAASFMAEVSRLLPQFLFNADWCCRPAALQGEHAPRLLQPDRQPLSQQVFHGPSGRQTQGENLEAPKNSNGNPGPSVTCDSFCP